MEPTAGMSSFPATTHIPFSFRTMPPSAIFFSGMFRLGFFFACLFFCCSLATRSSLELCPSSGLSSGMPFSRFSRSRNLTQHSFCHLSMADLTTVSSLRSLRLTRLPVMGDVPHDESSPATPTTAVSLLVSTSHLSIASRSYVCPSPSMTGSTRRVFCMGQRKCLGGCGRGCPPAPSPVPPTCSARCCACWMNCEKAAELLLFAADRLARDELPPPWSLAPDIMLLLIFDLAEGLMWNSVEVMLME
mmetsp:Transcript_10347/g.23616  ORF Transcript_10347/g.23616 Transcript_10347/m.23616 type:complete len:246 (-) Transcript_10347:454-1191(-)